MLRFFRNLKWLIDNVDSIKKLVIGPDKSKKKYSLSGVPEYQKDYIKKMYNKEK